MAGLINNVSVVDMMDAIYNGLPNRGEDAPNPSFPWEALSAVGGTLGALLSVFLVVLALVKAGLIETNRLLATVERLRGRNGGNNGGANVPPTPPPRNATDDEIIRIQMENLARDCQDAHLYSNVPRSEWI